MFLCSLIKKTFTAWKEQEFVAQKAREQYFAPRLDIPICPDYCYNHYYTNTVKARLIQLSIKGNRLPSQVA